MSNDLPRTRLQRQRDFMGWKPPWHEHFRLIRNGVDHPWDPRWPPVYAVNCSPAECQSQGCPKTASGFPEQDGVPMMPRSHP